MNRADDAEFALDRRALIRSFDRASVSYDAAALLQAQVRTELLERLHFLRRDPRSVLDLGCGTGAATVELAQRYPRASILGVDIAPGMVDATTAALRDAFPASALRAMLRRLLGRTAQRLPAAAQRTLRPPPLARCADASALPLPSAAVEIVFSSLMLQWCEDLDTVLAEVRRVLTPQGVFLFSTFGPDTLRELRAAWAAADGFNHVNRFLDMHELGSALSRHGFSEPVLDVDRVDRPCDDARELMRELKLIGAHNVTGGRARALTGKQRLRTMLDAYEAQRVDGRLPVTYEVIYGCAWAPSGAAAPDSLKHGEVTVDVAHIRRRIR